jgi:hypothetical protein
MQILNRLAFYAATSILVALASMAAAQPTLVMVEQPGCVYCQRWDAEIGPAYPKTAEGRFAPLIRADLRQGPPEGITYDRRVVFTPTFILVENGNEIGRLEGYPGDDFFWPLLTRLLEVNTAFSSATPTAPVSN